MTTPPSPFYRDSSFSCQALDPIRRCREALHSAPRMDAVVRVEMEREVDVILVFWQEIQHTGMGA